MNATKEAGSRRRRRLYLAGGAAVVLLVLAGAGVWWFLRDDAPAAVDLETAVAQVTDDDPAEGEGDGEASGQPTPEPPAGDVELPGVWTVDTTLGDFDFESATGSFAGFRVEEELSTIGSTTAVGRTGAVEGTLEIDGDTLVAAEIAADLSQLTTNDSRRDSRARGALNTSEFPLATFVLTSPVELPADAAEGGPVAVTASGDLTISGVTLPVEFPLETQLANGVIVVVGSLDVVFSDFGVSVPSAPIVVSVEDQGIVEMQLLFTKEPGR